jgi:hypothetical protein
MDSFGEVPAILWASINDAGALEVEIDGEKYLATACDFETMASANRSQAAYKGLPEPDAGDEFGILSARLDVVLTETIREGRLPGVAGYVVLDANCHAVAARRLRPTPSTQEDKRV